jgi:hypothetical protein
MRDASNSVEVFPMHRSVSSLLAVAALSVSVVALAQTQTQTQFASAGEPSYIQSAPAPIERQFAPDSNDGGPGRNVLRAGHLHTVTTQPVAGVRIVSDEPITASDNAGTIEVHVTHGRANVSVDHPEGNPAILVDLPGGQAALVHDGFYAFNAGTNRVVVLHGEARVFAPGAAPDAKGRSVHEGEEGTLTGSPDVGYATQEQLRADLIPMYGTDQGGAPRSEPGYGNAPPPPAYGYYGGYPAYAYGYPAYGYGYGYPWGPEYAWGYPYGFGLGFGLGFGGYYGGYYGGGYGYGGGYRGFRSGEGYGGGGGYRGGTGGGFHGGSVGGSAHGGGGHR